MSGSQLLLLGGTPQVASDPYFEYTTLLLPGNGTNGAQNNTFLDSSTNNFTITRNGNTTQGTFSPFSQTGWGNYFDGSGDELTVPSNAAFNLSSGAWTVEAWVYPTAFSGYNTIISARSAIWEIGVNTGTPNLYFFNGGLTTTSNTLTLDAWNHVAVSSNGTTISLFINGVLGATVNTNPGSTASTVYIGSANGLQFFSGYISNLRVVKGTQVYTAAFTPPTTPLTAISGTSLLTCQSNRFIDNSTNNFAITRNGDVSVQAFSPFNPTAAWSASTNGGSGYFDGSGDYLSTTTNLSAIGTGDFTLEVWCYPTATTSYRYFLAIGPDTNFATGLSTGGYAPYLYSSGFIITSSISTVPNAWNHVQYVRSSGTLTVYVNGVSGGSVTWTGSIAAGRGYIGANDSNLYYFFGYHSSLRFSNIARAVSVPTAPYTSDANTQLLLNYTNAGIYDATSKNDLETVGNAQISTTQSKFGGSSMYFDGTGDRLPAPASVDIAIGTADFTIEGWFYTASPAANRGLFQISTTAGGLQAGNTNTLAVYCSSSVFGVYYASTVKAGTTSISANTWTHFALVRYSGSTKLYVNGITDGGFGTNADTQNYTGKNVCVGGYYNTSYLWSGYIQDFRITKGIARYTSNFTPPTTAFLTL